MMGTEVEAGADLAKQLAEHGVVVVRHASPLEDAELRALASHIGPIKDPVGRSRDGRPLRYSEERQIIDSGFVLTDELRAKLGNVSLGGDTVRPGLFEFFHTDDSYTECPAAATVLHARALPASGGGATRFMDMRAAFQLLEPTQRERLLGLRPRTPTTTAARSPRAPPQARWSSSRTSRIRSRASAHGTAGALLDLDRATHIDDARKPRGGRSSRCRTTPSRKRRATRTSGDRTTC